MLAASACAPAVVPPVEPVPVAIGCLEVAVGSVRDADGAGPVLEWHVTNVCDHAVPVDLANARVFAIGPKFVRTELQPSTPHAPLAPGWIDGGETAVVRVGYMPHVAARDVAVEVELDAFYEQSHRHVIVEASWLPADRRAARAGPDPGPPGGAP